MYAILKNDTSTTIQKKRVPYIDIAKGIAIICIILGHLKNPQINRVVFTFHVPIFYFITGYFINNKLQIKDFIKKKARTLLVPYACTCLAIILLYILKSAILEGSVTRQGVITWIYAAIYGAGDSYTHPFYIKAIGAIWFLWATFWGEIFLYRLLSVNKEMRIAIVVLLFIVGYYSRRLFWFPFSIQAGCCATMFMYIGYLIRGAKETLKELSLETKLVCTLAALLVWLAFIRDFKSFWLVHCDIGRGGIDIIGCICGCYIIILLSIYIHKYIPLLSKILSFLGRYSLFVLCIHIIELNLFPWGRAIQKLVEYGMPSEMELCIMIAGKMTMIVLTTICFTRCNVVRKIFGYDPLQTKEGDG